MGSFAQIVYNCEDPNEYTKILNEYDNVIKKVAILKKNIHYLLN